MPKNKKSRRDNKKRQRKSIYYDACALLKGREVIDEIRGRSMKEDILISPLALGEAYGSCCRKNIEAEETFRELLEHIRGCIVVIKNDISDALFDGIRDECRAIKIADAIHLATAVKYKCSALITTDRDLYGLTKKVKDNICKRYCLSEFTITQI